MGCVMRRVPKDWSHPMEDGRYVPLFNGDDYHTDLLRWETENTKWEQGYINDYMGGWSPKPERYHGMSYADFDGEKPDHSDYMPTWSTEEKTHYMMYCNATYGTPMSPAFPTAEELATWLYENKVSMFARVNSTYEHWLSAVKAKHPTDGVVFEKIRRRQPSVAIAY